MLVIIKRCETMKSEKRKLSGIVITSLILLGSFVYALNAQPAVGDFNTCYELKHFHSYAELTDFIKESSMQSHNQYWEYSRLSTDPIVLDVMTAKEESGDTSGGETVDY